MLMRTDPFRDLDRLAQQLLGTTARPAAMAMDAWRDGDEFVIELDVPGVSADSIDIDVERNVLTVRAERPQPKRRLRRRRATPRGLRSADRSRRHTRHQSGPCRLQHRGPRVAGAHLRAGAKPRRSGIATAPVEPTALGPRRAPNACRSSNRRRPRDRAGSAAPPAGPSSRRQYRRPRRALRPRWGPDDPTIWSTGDQVHPDRRVRPK